MNGTSSLSKDHHDAHREAPRPPQISQALLQGALEISAIFERRVAALRADYEHKIWTLAQERDALLAKANDNVGPGQNGTLVGELEHLRRESESWEQDRAQWERVQADFAHQRASWAQEREMLQQERTRLERESEESRRAHEAWQNERITLLQECDRIRSEGDTKLREAVASKDALIEELEARVRWLESTQTQAVTPAQQPTVLDQNQFDPLDIFQSPPRLEAYPTMSSTLGTLTPAKSPSSDSAPMQVRTPQPIALPLEFEPELDAFFATILHNAQVDDHPPAETSPKSPTITLREGQSPTFTLRTAGRSPSVARSPTMFSMTATSHSSGLGITGTRRLVIRVPPAAGPVRRPIKSPVSPSTEQEMRTIVHVPPSQDTSDKGSPTNSSDTSTSSPGSSSSSTSS